MKKKDSKKRIAYCVLLLLLLFLFSANFIQKKISLKTSAASEESCEAKIRALILREKNEQARQMAFSELQHTDSSDRTKLSFLYNSIGKSYQNSFHFDSAVYYAMKAYDASKQTSNKQSLTESATELLRVYNQSTTYLAQQDSVFNVLNNIDKRGLTVQTQSKALDVITQYHVNKVNEDMAIFTATQAVNLYTEYLRNHFPDHEDSANIAACYLQMSFVYLSYNYHDNKAIPVLNENKQTEGLNFFKIARSWIGNKSNLLALYYYRACLFKCFENDSVNLQHVILCRDSLTDLARTTGYNFNDMLLIANVSLCITSYYFYKTCNRQDKAVECWKYNDEAAKYDKNLFNPSCHYSLLWQKGFLFNLFHQYSKGLFFLKQIAPEISLYNIKERLLYIGNMVTCYEGLGNKDSALAYNKKYIVVSDSLNKINLRKITIEADDKYQDQIRESKIDEQNIIIQYTKKERRFFFVGIFILLCLVVMLIIIYRNKRIAANNLDEKNTILKSLNRHLKEANETKAKLFAIIGHDLRSPIEELHLLLKLQRSKDFVLTTEKKHRYEEDIQFATTNLLESMEGLLIWSRTQLQSFAPVKSSVDVNKIMNQCIHLMYPLINSKRLKIENQFCRGA